VRYDETYHQYQQRGIGISDYGYPEFPAYRLNEEVEDHEFGYQPFPAYQINYK
jgi:hypothetical protein